jgi:cytoskeleton protein RodZ
VSESEDKSTDMQRPGGIGPGERLQAARIKKGLSLEDVASRMHLSSNILEAIEDNNFDVITAPIFVKGYLRAYARIVSLNEDEMIQQYVDFYSEEDPPINSTSNMVPELSATDARIKWTTYFVILVLGVLLAAWWWNKQEDQEPPVSLDVQSSRTEELASTESVVDSDIQAGSETEIGAEASAPMAESEPSEATATTVVDSGVENAGTVDAPASPVVADAVTTEAAVEPVATAGVVVSPLETDTSLTTAEPEPEPEPQAIAGSRDQPTRIAPSGSDKLKIIIHADTWADVKDSTNYQLVYDLLRADSLVELSGKAPFTVFLGNGHGVEILFNGEEIGFSARIRDDNTARIKIGG